VLAFLERNVYSGSAINWPAVQCLTADICYGGSSATATTDRRVAAAFAEAWLTSSLGASQSFAFNLKSAVAPPAITAAAVSGSKLSMSNAQQQQQQQAPRETGATAAALAVINKGSSRGKGAASSGSAAATSTAAAAKHRYTAPAHTELAEVVQFISALPDSDAPAAVLGLHSATCAAAAVTAGHALWSSVIAATSTSTASASASSGVSGCSAAAKQKCAELATLLSDMLADAGYAALHEGTVSEDIVTPMEAFIQQEGVLLCEQLTAAATAVDQLQQALTGQVSYYSTYSKVMIVTCTRCSVACHSVALKSCCRIDSVRSVSSCVRYTVQCQCLTVYIRQFA
jgi:hypothetical protein